MTASTLRIFDYGLMTAGGVVWAIAIAWWLWRMPGRPAAGINQTNLNGLGSGPVRTPGSPRRSLRPGGLRDPLRGSPLRTNRLAPIHVWLCVAGSLMGLSVGAKIAAMTAPPGLEGEPLQTWRGVFAAGFAAIVNTVVCLGVAKATFTGGLRGFGIGRRRLSYELTAGVAGWLAGLCLTGLALLGTQWVVERVWPDFQPPEHGVFQTLRDPALRPWMHAWALLGAAVVVPVGEELLFRGIFQTGFQKLIPARPGSLLHRWAAVLAIGTLFGLVHWTTPQHTPALVLFGILLGFLYERTGSLIVTILVHMLFNGKSLLWDHLIRASAHGL